MNDNGVNELDVLKSKSDKLISVVVVLLLVVFCFVSLVVVYFSYSYDVDHYEEKTDDELPSEYDEKAFDNIKEVYHLHSFNELEYTTLIDSNIMTLFYSNDFFDVSDAKYNPAVVFYIMRNVRNKEIVSSNTSLNTGFVSFDEDTFKKATYNVFGNNFVFDRSKIIDMNSCPSLSFNPITNKYDIGLSCGDTSGVLAFTKVHSVIEKDDEIYLYEKVLFVFGDAVKDKYLDGEHLGKIDDYESIWEYEDDASIYKYTFNKDENNIYYLNKVEHVKNT